MYVIIKWNVYSKWNGHLPDKYTWEQIPSTTTPQGADPGFLLGGGAPLRNDVTIQYFSQEGVHL